MRQILIVLALALRSCAPEPVYAAYSPEECQPVAQYAYYISWMKDQKWSIESVKAKLDKYFIEKKYTLSKRTELLDFVDTVWSMTGDPDYVSEKMFNICTGSLPS